MPATVTTIAPRPTSGPPATPQPPPRRPFRDNPRLILAVIAVLVAVLVALFLGMTLIPTVLVLIVGSELIRTNIDRWFNAPMAEILSSANQIASDYYHERQMLVSDHVARIARGLAAVDLTASDVRPIRDLLAPEVTLQRVQMVEVYRIAPSAGSPPSIEPVVDVAAPALPPGYSRAAADRLAAQALGGSAETSIEALGAAGDLLHAAAVIRS